MRSVDLNSGVICFSGFPVLWYVINRNNPRLIVSIFIAKQHPQRQRTARRRRGCPYRSMTPIQKLARKVLSLQIFTQQIQIYKQLISNFVNNKALIN